VQLEIRGLERLSHRERQVVALKETGLGNDAVAKRLGLKPGTVATLYNRARAKGYQVVLVIAGDPLGVYGDQDDADDGDPEDGSDRGTGGGDDGVGAQ
jgi:hypothetical protein